MTDRPFIRWHVVLLCAALVLVVAGLAVVAPNMGRYWEDFIAKDVEPRLVNCWGAPPTPDPSALDLQDAEVLLIVEAFPTFSSYMGAAVYVRDGTLFVRATTEEPRGEEAIISVSPITFVDAELDRGLERPIRQAAESVFTKFKSQHDAAQIDGVSFIVRSGDNCGITHSGNHGWREISLLLSALRGTGSSQVREAVDALLAPPDGSDRMSRPGT